MSTELSPLQLQAAQLLGRGVSPTDVKKYLELPQTLFAQWREDPIFNGEVERLQSNADAALEGESLLEAAHAFGLLDDAPLITKDNTEGTEHYDPATNS